MDKNVYVLLMVDGRRDMQRSCSGDYFAQVMPITLRPAFGD